MAKHILSESDLALYRDGRRVNVEESEALLLDEQTGEVAVVFRTRLSAIERPGAPVASMLNWQRFAAGELADVSLDDHMPISGSMTVSHFTTNDAGRVYAHGAPVGRLVDWHNGADIADGASQVAVPADALRKLAARSTHA